MKLKLMIVAVFAASCLLTFSERLQSGLAAQQQKLPGDDLIIPSVHEKWGKVKFTHQQHLKFSDCTYCHHTNKGLTLESFNANFPEKIPLCVECHTREEGNEKNPVAADGLEIWSKEAYHINCIDCHKAESMEDVTRVPKDGGKIHKFGNGVVTKCAECHEQK